MTGGRLGEAGYGDVSPAPALPGGAARSVPVGPDVNAHRYRLSVYRQAPPEVWASGAGSSTQHAVHEAVCRTAGGWASSF